MNIQNRQTSIILVVTSAFLLAALLCVVVPVRMPHAAAAEPAPTPSPTFALPPIEGAQATQPAGLGFFGMNTYFTGQERIWNDVDEVNDIDGVQQLVQQGRLAGVDWAREELSWGVLERHRKGGREWYQFDERIQQAGEAGYGIIGMLLTTPDWARVSDCESRIERYASEGVTTQSYWCPPENLDDFADYVRAVVERYDGDGVKDVGGSPRIAVWQIWNEPNHWETWPGSPEEYGRLLEAGYNAVKEADPTAIVATGGLYVFDGVQEDGVGHHDGLLFMERVLAAYPAAWNAFDALAIHPFMPDVAPDQPDILSKVTLWGRITTASDWMTARTAEYGGTVRPLWITEMGWSTCTFDAALASDWSADLARYTLPTHSGSSLALSSLCKDEQQQATYMVRAHVIAWALGVQHLSYFQLEDKFDGGHSIWSDMSIVRTRSEDYRPKIAYNAYTVLTSQLENAVFLGLGPLHTYPYNAAEQHNPSGIYHATFIRTDNVVVDVVWHSGGTAEVELELYPERKGILVTRDGSEVPFDPQQSKVRFTISEEPVYLRQELINPPTPTPTPPPSPTATTIPTTPPTATATPTTPPTATPPPTTTPTPSPLPTDSYEPDDTCIQAQTIRSDGIVQNHTFHDPTDIDWMQFDAISGTTYLIESQVEPGTAVDLALELVTDCDDTHVTMQAHDETPGPNIRLTYHATLSDTVRLKVTNAATTTATTVQLDYAISVQALEQNSAGHALILVVGKLEDDDPLQQNMHHVAAEVYDLFTSRGYAHDNITYLATDMEFPGGTVDAPATATNLEQAITEWATRHATATLTLYLVDHGDAQRFSLDKPAGEWVSASDLDSWLAAFEAARPEAKVNVIIESPSAGTLITAGDSTAQTGSQRVVITATGDEQNAYTSQTGALFSDYLLQALRFGSSLYHTFQQAQQAVETAHPDDQTPWLESNGNTIPNEAIDALEAQRRSLPVSGTVQAEVWPPFITTASDAGETPGSVERSVEITATVIAQPGTAVERVWAVIYPPSYQPSAADEQILRDDSAEMVLPLQHSADGVYTATSPGLDEAGSYRIVVYAEDERGMLALPVAFEVMGQGQVFLPLVNG